MRGLQKHLRYTFAIGVHDAQVELRVSIAILGSGLFPLHFFSYRISARLRPQAECEGLRLENRPPQLCQPVSTYLGILVPICCRYAEVSVGPKVLRRALTVAIQFTNGVLRFDVTLLGRGAIPLDRLSVILRRTCSLRYMKPRLNCASASPALRQRGTT